MPEHFICLAIPLRIFFRVLLICSFNVLVWQNASAEPSGPAVVATANYLLWHEPMNTTSGFDKASRAALLVYAHNLDVLRSMPREEMLTAFKVDNINEASVQKWIRQEQALTLINYQRATKNCDQRDWTCNPHVTSFATLLKRNEQSLTKAPADALAWLENLENFTHQYIIEQMRLAALFPRITSEIDTFANEWTGSQLADKQFYLTFDDGPTGVGGATDDTLKMLTHQKKTATFFVIGSNLQNRLAVLGANKNIYANQCVALHGWEHLSHAQWDLWQDSVIRTQQLVTDNVDKSNILPLFRPPYGQRKPDSPDFFKSRQLKVALWNIDAQDWIENVDVNTVVNRVVALALIKRHGVVLFHDVHSKAAIGLPMVFERLGNSVVWNDCHGLGKL